MKSPIRIIECEQGSPDWLKARAGVVTASMFHVLGKKGRGGAPSDVRTNYLYQLAGEIITGEIAETYDGGALARGHRMEGEARSVYELMTGEECRPVGFIVNDVWGAGASPDSLIGKVGGLEVKSKKPSEHIKVIRTFKKTGAEIPEDHIAQVQGSMGVTNREWWDFISYWPKMKPFIQRAYRDEAVIARLKIEVKAFNDELAELVKELRS